MKFLFAPLLRRRSLAGVVGSTAVHLGAIAGLIAVELSLLLSSVSVSDSSAMIELESEVVHQPPPRPTTIDIAGYNDPAWMAASSIDVSDLVANVDDPRWRDALLDEPQSSQRQDQTADFIAEQVLAAIQRAEEQSPQDNLERLEHLSGQLSAVSSEESVDAMAAKLKKWLGTDDRASAPAAEAVAGELDFGTAQLHDVRRIDENGEVRYTAVLLDSEGRTTETELTAAEGENVYRVMQLIKDNPLLERVYRGIVLAMLDKLLRQQ